MKKFTAVGAAAVVIPVEEKFRVVAVVSGAQVYSEEFLTEGVAEHVAKQLIEVPPARPEFETVKIEHKVSEELAKDILSIAVEGGSNYWGSFGILQGKSDDYTAVTVKDVTGEDAGVALPNVVTLTTVRNGLELAVKPSSMREDLREACIKALENDDACYMDADSADCVVQLGLFGEIVFG